MEPTTGCGFTVDGVITPLETGLVGPAVPIHVMVVSTVVHCANARDGCRKPLNRTKSTPIRPITGAQDRCFLQPPSECSGFTGADGVVSIKDQLSRTFSTVLGDVPIAGPTTTWSFVLAELIGEQLLLK